MANQVRRAICSIGIRSQPLQKYTTHLTSINVRTMDTKQDRFLCIFMSTLIKGPSMSLIFSHYNDNTVDITNDGVTITVPDGDVQFIEYLEEPEEDSQYYITFKEGCDTNIFYNRVSYNLC